MKRMAIIPARSGSKGLKDKNIIDLCGKPLIAYSIEAANKSGMFDEVIVSTDSERYAEIAKAYGAKIHLRRAELATDTATTYAVIKDVLEGKASSFDYFVLLQPTSPLRNETHLKEACTLFEQQMEKFDFLVSVKEAEHPAVLVRPIEEDGSLKYFDTDFSNYRRQTFADYTPNGAIYIAKPQQYLERKHFFGEKSLAYRMNQLDSVDIDTKLDYELAKLIVMGGHHE